jgi:predicted O-methyltransferase YrrM
MNLPVLRKYCIDRNIPIISIETESFLWDLLEQHKPKVCLEIGSAVWYSSIFIANKIKEWGGILYSFEISYTAYLESIQNIWKYELKNLIVYPFDFLKTDIKKLIPNTLDFVFVDWQKSQYVNYLMNIYNILSTKNILVCDDVIKYKHKMIWLYEFLKKKQILYKEIEMEDWDGVILIDSGCHS